MTIALLAMTQPRAMLAEEKLHFIPEANVRLTDSFWGPVLERNRTITVPHNLAKCREVGSIANFERVAGLKAGDYHGLPNWDEFLYEAIEAGAYALAQEYDAKLDRELDEIIGIIAKAQDDDGYLRTVIQLSERGRGPAGLKRWANLGDNLELYCSGHLFEAAVAHHQSTGKRTLLQVALKNAELIDCLFRPGKRVEVCGHEEIEPALVRLHEATGDRRWLDFAKFFVDTRGTETGGRRKRGSFSQDHAPLFEQTEAVGQAPRATYYYSGAADVGRLTGDSRYHQALRRLWEDVVFRKMYITGGIGWKHKNEGFGDAYDLPNLTAYTEVCAAISFAMWAARMFKLKPDAGYFNVIERVLYNNLLAGVSLSGDRYFYVRPLESDGKFRFNLGWMPGGIKGIPYADKTATRKEWFPCACCPPNLARYLPQVQGLIYATRGSDVYVNLFADSEAEIKMGYETVRVRQKTNYPWDGSVELVVDGKLDGAIHLRIPSWARNQPVPSDLYSFADESKDRPEIMINGSAVDSSIEKGYAVLRREWKTGDRTGLQLPMPVRRIVSYPAVKANVGKVALQRGPILYCFEGADHGGRVLDLALPPKSVFTARRREDLLGSTIALEGSAVRAGRPVPVVAISYHLWSNRGAGEMVVWLNTLR